MEIINIHGGDQSSLSVIQSLILSTSFNELSVFWIFCIIKKCIEKSKFINEKVLTKLLLLFYYYYYYYYYYGHPTIGVEFLYYFRSDNFGIKELLLDILLLE